MTPFISDRLFSFQSLLTLSEIKIPYGKRDEGGGGSKNKLDTCGSINFQIGQRFSEKFNLDL